MGERWVSGSALKRALTCPASTVLKRSRKSFSDNADRASEFGTLAHEYVENGTIYESTQEWCSRFDRDKLYPARGLHEVVGWYNPEDGEFGLRPPGEALRVHRDYAFLPDAAIVGTIDYMAPAKDGRWWVDDLKTGNAMWVPHPDTPQMMLAATIISHVFDCDVISTITACPRYPKGTKPKRTRCDITRAHAASFKEKLDILYGQYLLEQRRSDLGIITDVPSDECKFCPSRFFCPSGIEVEDERNRAKAAKANE